MHLRDAHYQGARSLGHGKGYRYPRHDSDGWVAQQHRPAEVAANVCYEPSGHGAEAALAERRPGPSQPGPTGQPAASHGAESAAMPHRATVAVPSASAVAARRKVPLIPPLARPGRERRAVR